MSSDEREALKKELTKQFGEGLKAIQLSDDLMEWVVPALKSSHIDRKCHHNKIVNKLQAEYNKLQHRLDNLYIDKLDEKISQEFYDQKRVNWRREQADILRKIEMHQNANESYIEEGIKNTGACQQSL